MSEKRISGLERIFNRVEALPAFKSQSEAEAYYFGYRDEYVKIFLNSVTSSGAFDPDFSPESLKAMEAWFVDGVESGSNFEESITKEDVERGMSMYFGEVCVRNTPAEWMVQSHPIDENKYEFGVTCKGVTMLLKRFADIENRRNNKRRQSIYREYQQYFGSK